MKSKSVAIAGIFAAIIIVLQLISTFVKFGPVNITLALTPVIIGGALYGRRFGALCGTVLGVFIAVAGLLGWDGGFVLSLATYHPVIIILVAVLKSTFAGYFAGIAYQFISKKNMLAAVITSGLVCPIVNTGIFISAMFLFFREALMEMAGGTAILQFTVVSLVGINFIVELVVNMLLATATTRIIKVSKRKLN